MTLIISDIQQKMQSHNAECHYPECHLLFMIVLNVIMLSVIMLNVMAPNNDGSKMLTDPRHLKKQSKTIEKFFMISLLDAPRYSA